MIAVLSFNLLGDAWRYWLAPRMRSQLEVAHLSR
jgi:ABC-type dipeptide/oligopeptide/nickel transport system permease subunit